MEDHPKVSVVIATYNRARFLPETIESVLKQRFRDFELIVVDDGSTDETREVLRSYGDRVRSFYHENRGPSAARNLGIRQARGRWISIQDSDDLCTADHLEALFGFADKNPGLGMVFGNGAYLGGPEHNRETIIPEGKSRRLAQQGVKLVDLFDKSIVRLQAALISREYLEAIGGLDENLHICMDLDLAFRLFMRYPVTYLDRVVFLYRKHEGNIGRNQELRLLENIRVIEKLLREFPESRDLLGMRRIAHRIAYRYYRLAKGRWKAGDRGGAREAIRKATSICPFSLKYRLYQLRWI
ncbi:MAG: glycosyltransferase [Candidatus Manganitrophaceae bacterium]|nr:MAG: glycosyltransferase [Candidatus Manganitrophaceae bacterium]